MLSNESNTSTPRITNFQHEKYLEDLLDHIGSSTRCKKKHKRSLARES